MLMYYIHSPGATLRSSGGLIEILVLRVCKQSQHFVISLAFVSDERRRKVSETLVRWMEGCSMPHQPGSCKSDQHRREGQANRSIAEKLLEQTKFQTLYSISRFAVQF
jgi:hypothetical protein